VNAKLIAAPKFTKGSGNRVRSGGRHAHERTVPDVHPKETETETETEKDQFTTPAGANEEDETDMTNSETAQPGGLTCFKW
jgi:hypothetical protein